MTALLVLLGGALGAPARWYVDQQVRARHDTAFPWGTFLVNTAGSFALGLLLGLTSSGDAPLWVALLGTGFCGAFTTFSTFGFETVRLAEEGEHRAALTNVAASLALGLAAAAAGWELGRICVG